MDIYFIQLLWRIYQWDAPRFSILLLSMDLTACMTPIAPPARNQHPIPSVCIPLQNEYMPG